MNPTTGINSGTVTINTSTAGLNPGRYLGNINVYSNGGNKTIKMSGNISPIPTLPAISPVTSEPTITPTQINGPIISDTVIVALIGALATIITAYLTYRAAKKK